MNLLGVLLCVGPAGCNQILGLQKTELYSDAPADAPFVCPSSGVPMFKSAFRRVTTTHCRSYTATTSDTIKLAAADCDGGGMWGGSDHIYVVFPIGEEPDPSNATIVFRAASNGSTLIAPEGDQIWITYYPPTGGLTLVSYVAGGTTWTQTANPVLPTTFDNNDRFSSPSQRPRRALHYHAIDQTWYEVAETTSGTWTMMRTHPELGAIAESPRLSADGLRVTAAQWGTDGFLSPVFASRTSIDAPFTSFSRIATAPQASGDPFLSPNCGDLYWSDAGIFAVQQL